MRGKTAIVTGASRGIGYAAMAMLVSEGVNVAAVSRTREALEAAASELSVAGGGSITVIPADVSREDEAVSPAGDC